MAKIEGEKGQVRARFLKHTSTATCFRDVEKYVDVERYVNVRRIVCGQGDDGLFVSGLLMVTEFSLGIRHSDFDDNQMI